MTSLPPGSTFAGYVIDAEIARGGMGVVYRATQNQPHRQIALKLIAPEHAADPGYRERFLREADLLASVEHCPSIVPIYASGEFEGQLYLAMRYMDGPDLGERLQADGPLSLTRTVQILRPVAAALDAAHESGLVHRDVKPANILFDSRDRVYLTDFGLTKRAASDSGLTRPGTAVGTTGYMAPEQFTGRPSDPAMAPRIDVYALGCVLHACLTGTEPYTRDSYEQAMFAHVYEPPPKVTTVRPDLPPVVDDILARALAKDPAERYATAEDLVAALADAVPLAGPYPPASTIDAGADATISPDPADVVPPPPTERRRIEIAPVVSPNDGRAATEGRDAGGGVPTADGPTSGRAGMETVVVTGSGGGAGGGARPGTGRVGGPPPRRPILWLVIAGVGAVVGIVLVLAGTGVILNPTPSSSPIAVAPSRSPALSSGPTPISTPTPTPTATPIATETSTPTRTPAAGGRFGSDADMATLLSMVPADLRSTCESSEMFTEFGIAKVMCDQGTTLVWYELHPDLAALKGDFDVVVRVSGIEAETGDCLAGTPGESGWKYTDDPSSTTRGRYICENEDSGYASMEITYEDELVSVELYDDSDIKTLYDLWSSGSLNPSAP